MHPGTKTNQSIQEGLLTGIFSFVIEILFKKVKEKVY
jgi:hypothetical protein